MLNVPRWWFWTHFLNKKTGLYDRRWWWKAFGYRIWLTWQPYR
jgi:hypothetical protein